MIKRLMIVLAALLLLAIGYFLWPSSAPLPEPKNDTVVWLGDSIGEGYGASEGNSPPEFLGRQLGVLVINESTSGDTTADGVEKISRVLEHDPGLVIIQLAGNDALRKRPQTETEANLRAMIEAFQSVDAVVMLVGIRSGPFVGGLNDMFEALVGEYKLLYLPDALKGLFGRAEYMADPIHPNDAGSEILAERVYEVVAPMYER